MTTHSAVTRVLQELRTPLKLQVSVYVKYTYWQVNWIGTEMENT